VPIRAAVLFALLYGFLAGCDTSVPEALPAQQLAQADPHPVPAVALPVVGMTEALRARLAAPGDPWLGRQSPRDRGELQAVYAPGDQAPLWVDQAGRPTDDARAALALFAAARTEGLDPADYGVEPLAHLAATIEAGPARPADVAAFDVAMSAGTLRYFRHLHLGRVDPLAVGFRLVIPVESHDFVALLRSALAEHGIARTVASLAPSLGQYDALRGVLADYRAIVAATRLDPAPAPARTVRPGERHAGLQPLRQRLTALGDLAPDAPASVPDAYEGPLVQAVQRFQARHGLEPDGVIGRSTRAALDLPLTWRVRQIELALERLRWLPDPVSDRLVALNIPMFQLWGWDAPVPSGPPDMTMRAIVGKAIRTETPVFVATMRTVIFRPYWNVPRSILLKELLPILDRDLDYLRREDMEMVAGQGDDAQPVAPSAGNVARLRRGELRLRQRPGPQNALALVKFDFPNDADVYMHGTPAQSLFGRARRDFSHGCVRVEDPVALAEWVLHDDTAWSRARIVEAMTGPTSRRIELAKPIRVMLFYTTAVVLSADGAVHFADDIYGHDAQLDRALTRALPGLQ
jgi:L,D-transpeptidase YcbB